MSKRLQLTFVLVAWFLATGAQWGLVQTFGWLRMVVKYSQSMSVANAVKKTFSGEMCGVCEAVQDTKQQETGPAVPNKREVDGKMLVVHAPVTTHPLAVLQPEAEWPGDPVAISLGRSAPPLPPPRV